MGNSEELLLTPEEIRRIIAPYRGEIKPKDFEKPYFTLEKEVAKAQLAKLKEPIIIDGKTYRVKLVPDGIKEATEAYPQDRYGDDLEVHLAVDLMRAGYNKCWLVINSQIKELE